MDQSSISVRQRRAIRIIPLALSAALGACLVACGGGPIDAAHEDEAKPAEVSQALSSYEWDYEYYSDATYTTMVGFYGGSCGGGTEKYGSRTKYVIGSRTNCRTNVSVGCWEIIDGRDYCGYLSCVIC